ncbi:hypothetical protein CP98_05357 [Sphingobium yanoikuyae]|jgi:hypothetical protein|uniref:Uncharacterized protein n=1 Tax=Sphingobium yanoikuyae TaxID=13690 RepID=A0A084E1U3_SPHYA|nr:hypothetical protein CP98_05357 [Sphingobium yanoikuyae]
MTAQTYVRRPGCPAPLTSQQQAVIDEINRRATHA